MGGRGVHVTFVLSIQPSLHYFTRGVRGVHEAFVLSIHPSVHYFTRGVRGVQEAFVRSVQPPMTLDPIFFITLFYRGIGESSHGSTNMAAWRVQCGGYGCLLDRGCQVKIRKALLWIIVCKIFWEFHPSPVPLHVKDLLQISEKSCDVLSATKGYNFRPCPTRLSSSESQRSIPRLFNPLFL